MTELDRLLSSPPVKTFSYDVKQHKRTFKGIPLPEKHMKSKCVACGVYLVSSLEDICRACRLERDTAEVDNFGRTSSSELEDGFIPPPQQVCHFCERLFDSNMRRCPHCGICNREVLKSLPQTTESPDDHPIIKALEVELRNKEIAYLEEARALIDKRIELITRNSR